MHEDIDDFEPDLNAYYRMDPYEKKLRNEKYHWEIKYQDGKISYDKYINGLKDFREILDVEDWREIENYEKDQKNKKAIEEEKKAFQSYKKQLEREEFGNQIGCILGIIMRA